MSGDLKQSICQRAREIGFDLVGVTVPVIEDRYRRAYLTWLERQYHGQMGYMARNIDKRLDPAKLVPRAKSVICVGMNYYQREPQTGGLGRVAMYAWGRDYHRVLKARLAQLADEIELRTGRKGIHRGFVDTAPVLEKALAAQAGLGWIGANACLINIKRGSYLFLGELFTELELEPDTPAQDHCGRCRRCQESCPTGAIVEPGLIDARRCISYLTIEHSGPIDPNLSEKVDQQIFGCDICQQVCPFNRFAQVTSIQELVDPHLGPTVDPERVLRWDEGEYRRRVSESAAARASLAQWHRNARLLLLRNTDNLACGSDL